MGDGSLSQDEIDALLNMGDEGGAAAESSAEVGDAVSDMDLDSLLGDGSGGGGTLDEDQLASLTRSSTTTPGPAGGGRSAPLRTETENAELLMDVTLRFTVELGRTHMLIKDVLQLGEGSIVELDKNVGDEVDILVNDRLFGRGRLIILDQYFAVQITHILDPMERYRLL